MCRIHTTVPNNTIIRYPDPGPQTGTDLMGGVLEVRCPQGSNGSSKRSKRVKMVKKGLKEG